MFIRGDCNKMFLQELRKLGSKVQKYFNGTSWKGIVDQIQQYLKCKTGHTEGPKNQQAEEQ